MVSDTVSARVIAPRRSLPSGRAVTGGFLVAFHSLLEDSLGRAPTDQEIAPYWRALMAANPDASPTGDPNLLYSGTVLELPPR